jgi:hypothetical protein
MGLKKTGAVARAHDIKQTRKPRPSLPHNPRHLPPCSPVRCLDRTQEQRLASLGLNPDLPTKKDEIYIPRATAKTNQTQKMVAGAGFEPATFRL